MSKPSLHHEVLETVKQALTTKKVAEFVRDAFVHQYNMHFAPRQREAVQMVEDAFSLLEEAAHGPEALYALRQIAVTIPYGIFMKNEPNFWFNRIYSHYKQHIRADADYNQIAHYLQGAHTILDFGSGSGWFPAELAQHGFTVSAADVLDYRIPESMHIPFHLMNGPTDIENSTKKYDVITVKSVFHHIDKTNLQPILIALSKLTKRMIIEEDTYNLNSFDQDTRALCAKQPLLTNFLKLSAPEQLLAVSLGDFFSNVIMSGNFSMSMTFAFHTLSEWEIIFQGIGAAKVVTKKLGIEPERITPICRGMIIVDF